MMAGCVMAMEKVTLSRSNRVKLFDAFRHVGEDDRFRKLLISWMILGFGNLLSFSLFVEYITNKDYGFDFSEGHVSIITTVIPETCFFIFVLIWGRLFDRMDFYVLRCLINLIFAAGIIFYFLGDGLWPLYIGIGLHGVAKAGGNVAWSLWVTKFASAEHVAEYMSVHTFLTGCRGVVAPMVAFPLLAAYGPVLVGSIGASLIFIATAMLIPDLKSRDRGLPDES
jgi:MFS family permease